MRNIQDLSEFFKRLRREKLGEEVSVVERKETSLQPQLELRIQAKSPLKCLNKDAQSQTISPISPPKSEIKPQKVALKPLTTQLYNPLKRIYSEPELHNTFLKINENFDVSLNPEILRRVVDYRTSLELTGSAPDISDLHFNPYPPSAKVMPLNVRELEFNLTKKSQHSTFHTDSKLLKELEITSIRPNGNLYSTITQDEKLAYEDYFRNTANPMSFVKFILRLRRGDDVTAKTQSIYDYQSHMPYFSKLTQNSLKYTDQHKAASIGALNLNLLRSQYQFMNK